MKFSVKKWNKDQDYHECIDSHGNRHFFDLTVSGSVDMKPEDMVGLDFQCPDSMIAPYISIVNEFWEVKK